jgi:hypothetical protein
MLPFWDNSTAVFGQSLYVGTWNYANSGEVWILLKQVLLPLVVRNHLRAGARCGTSWSASPGTSEETEALPSAVRTG